MRYSRYLPSSAGSSGPKSATLPAITRHRSPSPPAWHASPFTGCTFWSSGRRRRCGFRWYVFQSAVFTSAFQPLTDALVLRLIPDKDTYGRQRLFLPLTYGFITTVMVLICQRFRWIAVFPAMSLLNIMFISFIFLAVKNPPISDSLRQARLAANRPGGGGVVPGFGRCFA